MYRSCIVVLLFFSIAFHSLSRADDPPNLVGCPSFDCAGDCSGYICIGSVVPDSYSDGWSGDRAHVGSGSGGVSPRSGSVMLSYDRTAAVCGPTNTCQVWQLIDVHEYIAIIRLGAARVEMQMYVNRVPGDSQTDTKFGMTVFSTSGSPSEWLTQFVDNQYSASGVALFSDADTSTWELLTHSHVLPIDADYIALCITAQEDIQNDSSCPEFDGHYGDDVNLQIYDITPPEAPNNLHATYSHVGVELTWDIAPEPNFEFYRIYRGDEPDFSPTAENLILETATPQYSSSMGNSWDYHYKVSVVTNADVEGPAVSPDTMTRVNGENMLHAVDRLCVAPNPFNSQTTISFDLSSEMAVGMHVYDVSGRFVDVLLDDEIAAQGRNEVVWQGRDQAGRQLPSGTYFYRLTAGGYSETRRMVLVK